MFRYFDILKLWWLRWATVGVRGGWVGRVRRSIRWKRGSGLKGAWVFENSDRPCTLGLHWRRDVNSNRGWWSKRGSNKQAFTNHLKVFCALCFCFGRFGDALSILDAEMQNQSRRKWGTGASGKYLISLYLSTSLSISLSLYLSISLLVSPWTEWLKLLLKTHGNSTLIHCVKLAHSTLGWSTF